MDGLQWYRLDRDWRPRIARHLCMLQRASELGPLGFSLSCPPALTSRADRILLRMHRMARGECRPLTLARTEIVDVFSTD